LLTSLVSLTWITISFHSVAETIIIDRTNAPQPSGSYRVNNRPETAPHTLFTYMTEDGLEEREETLDIRIFHDASVVEVFVNERTVVSTRVYAQECNGVRFFAGDNEAGEGGGAFLEDAQAWDGLSTRMSYVN
jgi:beta-fructofuranosidase